MHLLKTIIQELSSNCDGAHVRDSVGFSKGDSYKGNLLAHIPKWTFQMYVWAWKSAHKYKNQIMNRQEINIDAIPFPNKSQSDYKNDDGESFYPKVDSLSFEEKQNPWYSNGKYWDVERYSLPMDIPREFIKMIKDLQGYYYDYSTGEIIHVLKEHRKREMTKEELYNLDWKREKVWEDKEIMKIPYDYGFQETMIRPLLNRCPELKKEGFGWSNYSGRWEPVWFKPLIKKETILKKTPPKKLLDIDEIFDEIDNSLLYDYQKPHAKNLVLSHLINQNYFDGSSTGTGKTFVNLVVAKALGLKVLVICPLATIYTWKQSIKKIGNECIDVVNYALVRLGKTKGKIGTYTRGPKKGTDKIGNINSSYLTVTKNPTPDKYDPKYLYDWDLDDNTLVIIDEVHRTKNRKSQNYQFTSALVNKGLFVVGLSATAGNNPLLMAGIAKILKFFEKEWDFYSVFASNYGCTKGYFGWEFNDPHHSQQYHMERLHHDIFEENKGSRMDKKTLVDQGKFPGTKIICESFNLNGEMDNLNKCYNQLELVEEVIRKEGIIGGIEETHNGIGMDLKDRVRSLNESIQYFKKNKQHLQLRQKLRQKAELLKVKLLIDLANDHIEQDKHVVIFVNYTETVEALATELKTNCLYYGGNKSKTNEENRIEFEENREPIMICNIASAKEGIDMHDKYHKFERVTLIIPDDNAESIYQMLGRVQRAGGTFSTQYFVFIAGTVEEEVMDNVKSKIENQDLLNGSDATLI